MGYFLTVHDAIIKINEGYEIKGKDRIKEMKLLLDILKAFYTQTIFTLVTPLSPGKKLHYSIGIAIWYLHLERRLLLT